MSSLPHQPSHVASRRSGGPHTSMFLRMLVRAAVLRRGRAASALLAMVVAAAVATAMLNLYADVEAKLRKEFRSYGANVVVMGKDGTALPSDALSRVRSTLGGETIAVPFAYIVARTRDGQSVVVAGTDLGLVRQLNRWWSVTAWPSENGAALVGTRAATLVSRAGKPFDLSFQGRTIHLTTGGILQTGAAEDSRIYLNLPAFEAWTGVEPSTIEIAVNGSTQEINATIPRLARQLSAAQVRPLRQIVEAEARVLGKTRAALLAAAALIILTSALCLLATLTGWVFDRRRDFAIMKALGASERLLNGFFAAEAAALGVIGALVGFVIGIGLAAWIGRVNFHASVGPRVSVLPVVLAGSVAVALLSATLPISLLRRVEPAIILRGE
ncbi:MAG: ABC transporter permease [Acidobacteria bacterium]|nr:MAG: ABC transporter permease [Acidobacteriota bacterium]